MASHVGTFIHSFGQFCPRLSECIVCCLTRTAALCATCWWVEISSPLCTRTVAGSNRGSSPELRQTLYSRRCCHWSLAPEETKKNLKASEQPRQCKSHVKTLTAVSELFCFFPLVMPSLIPHVHLKYYNVHMLLCYTILDEWPKSSNHRSLGLVAISAP